MIKILGDRDNYWIMHIAPDKFKAKHISLIFFPLNRKSLENFSKDTYWLSSGTFYYNVNIVILWIIDLIQYQKFCHIDTVTNVPIGSEIATVIGDTKWPWNFKISKFCISILIPKPDLALLVNFSSTLNHQFPYSTRLTPAVTVRVFRFGYLVWLC